MMNMNEPVLHDLRVLSCTVISAVFFSSLVAPSLSISCLLPLPPLPCNLTVEQNQAKPQAKLSLVGSS